MIDRYLLRYFLAVIDCGSFSKAARQTHVSQPTLSVGIAKLERLVGAALFERSAKRVNLTEAGSRFAVHARRIENEFNLAQVAVLGLKPVRELKLGVLATFPFAHLGRALRAARDSPPDASSSAERLSLVAGNERELLQRLSRGQIDTALTIVRPDSDRFAHELLFEEAYALALPAAHPLAAQPSIAAEELADNTMIVRRHCEVLAETSRHFTERGVRPFFAFRGSNDEQVLALVQAGLGVTVMPACYELSGVVRPALTGFPYRRRIGLLHAAHAEAARDPPSPLLMALRARYAPGRFASAPDGPASAPGVPA
jgi:DNA-binding transcriptional LysR family regulator